MLLKMVATVILEFGVIIKLCLFHGLKPLRKKEGRDKKEGEEEEKEDGATVSLPSCFDPNNSLTPLVLRMCLL